MLIQISVYNDKLYVANVGSLPETWTVETLMSKHVSRPSNPTIAGCIYLTGKIETWGRGVEKIVRECRKHGCPNPQYSVNPGDPGNIMVRVDAAPDAIVEGRARSDGPINGPINNRVIQFIRDHAGCKRADIANGVGVSLWSLKRVLEGLSNEIEYRGSKKTGGYFPRGR